MSKDLAGESMSFLEVDSGFTVSALRKVLHEKHPLFSQMDSYAIAVNESYADDQLTIVENDIIAVIPPVSGG